jgi:hypothetical protein
MQRYHKKVYFPESDKDKLISFTDRLNTLKWGYTSHSLDNIKNRVVNTYALLSYIKWLVLSYKQIFEYYKADNGDIIKACYRIEYKDFDFILVLNAFKGIVTIYINSKGDNHETLQENLYCRT